MQHFHKNNDAHSKSKIDTNHLRKNIVFARLRGGERGKVFERGARGPAECTSVWNEAHVQVKKRETPRS